jgi:hypothetical protein
MTIYRWANRDAIPQRFLITNVDEFTYPGAGAFEGYRDYNAGMFVLERRFVNRWQARLSYVYSRTEGTVTNSATAGTNTNGFNSNAFETPNTTLVNRDGRLPLDRPNEFKLFAGYQIPVVEVSVNAYFRHLSGQTYTPFSRQTATRLNWTTSNDIQLQPQGENRIDALNVLDLRAEKVFSFDVHRFGIYADLENALNSSAILTRQTRFPSAVIGGATVAFGNVATVTPSRQITFGVRWSF